MNLDRDDEKWNEERSELKQTQAKICGRIVWVRTRLFFAAGIFLVLIKDPFSTTTLI